MGEDAEEKNLTMPGESPVAVGGHCILPDPEEEGAVHKGLTSSQTNHKVERTRISSELHTAKTTAWIRNEPHRSPGQETMRRWLL